MYRLDGRRRRLVGGAVLVALVLLAGCSYDPPDACGACGVDRAASQAELNLSVANATEHVQVRQDGSAAVETRIRLTGPDTDRLRSDAALRERLVASSLEHNGPAEKVTRLRTRMTGDTLVVTYRIPDFADRYPGGVLVVDAYNREQHGSQFGYEVRRATVTVTGPEGTVLANRPPSGTARERSVVFDEYVEARTYIVFAPSDGGTTGALATVALGTSVAAWVVPASVGGTVVPAAIFVGLAVLSRRLFGGPVADVREHVPRVALAWVVTVPVLLVALLQDPAGLRSGAWLWLGVVQAGLLAALPVVERRDRRWVISLGAMVGVTLLVSSSLVVEMTGNQIPWVPMSVWTVLVVGVALVPHVVVRWRTSRN